MIKYIFTLVLFMVFGGQAYMSVYGLVAFLSNNPYVAGIVGTGLECTKISIVIYAHREWDLINAGWKIFYSVTILALVLLTTIEVTGFLTLSHNISTERYQKSENMYAQLEKESSIIKRQLDKVDETIRHLPVEWVSRRLKEREKINYDQKQDRLQEIAKLQTKYIKEQKVEYSGPVFATAKMLDISPPKIARIFVLMIVLILEPASIGMAIAVSSLWQKPKQIGKMEMPYPAKQKAKIATPASIFSPPPYAAGTPKTSQVNLHPRQLEFHRFLNRQKSIVNPFKISRILRYKRVDTIRKWINNEKIIPEKAMRALRNWERSNG